MCYLYVLLRQIRKRRGSKLLFTRYAKFVLTALLPFSPVELEKRLHFLHPDNLIYL